MLKRARVVGTLVSGARAQWAEAVAAARDTWWLLRQSRGLVMFVLVLSVIGTTETVASNLIVSRSRTAMGMDGPEDTKSDAGQESATGRASQTDSALRQVVNFSRSHGLWPAFVLPELWPSGHAASMTAVQLLLISHDRQSSVYNEESLSTASLVFVSASFWVLSFAFWSAFVGVALGWARAVVLGVPFALRPFLVPVRRWGVPVFLVMLTLSALEFFFGLWRASVFRATHGNLNGTLAEILGVGEMAARVISMLAWLALYWWLVSATGFWAGLRTVHRAVWRHAPALVIVCVAMGTAGRLLWFFPSFAFGTSSRWALYTLVQVVILYPLHFAAVLVSLFGTLWLLLILKPRREAGASAGTMPYTA